MKFCESCRQTNQWNRNVGFPFVGVIPYDKCEICRRYDQLHEVDVRELKKLLTPERERTRQLMYRDKANSVMIYHESGPRHGQVNEKETAELKELFAYKNGEVEWIGTYELRLLAKHAAMKKALFDKEKRNQ